MSGDVIVSNAGALSTGGASAHGILAQSVGGGGGNAGKVESITSRPEGQTAQSITIGGTGGEGMKSGDVTVSNTGSITTSGEELWYFCPVSWGRRWKRFHCCE